MAVIGREAARAPLTSADINDGIVSADDLAATLDLSSKTITMPSLSTVDINGGTIDGVTIGGSSAGAITGTTGQFNTSLNVDGTVTADGVTVSTTTGSSSITPTDITIKTETSASDWSTTDEWGRLVFYSDDVSNGGAKAHATIGVSPTASGGGLSKLVFKTSNSTPSLVKRMDIDEVGDISFYEDTGTTPKFFWDASAERLGLGTTSPSTPLDVTTAGGGNFVATFQNTTSATPYGVWIKEPASAANSYPSLQVTDSTGSTVRFRVDSGTGNVGIGTSSPSGNLHVDGGEVFFTSTGNSKLQIKAGNTSSSFIEFGDPDDGNVGRLLYSHADNSMQFTVNASEAMRIDSSGNVALGNGAYIGTLSSAHSLSIQGGAGAPGGKITLYGGTGSNRIDFLIGASEAARIDSSGNLLVGKTSTSIGTAGARITADGGGQFVVNSSECVALNRLTSDGNIALFMKDGTTVGTINSYAGTRLGIGSNGVAGILFATNEILPATSGLTLADNTYDVGSASYRWDDVYATNGTIQTSDRNEKENIRELLEAEARVAQAAKGLLRAFQWKDSVAEKGDDARIHFGIIAQDLQAAFEAEGLDAGRYAMFIHSTWTDEETGEERSRMGVRYSELLAFIIAAL